jgi:hypothetical protein
MTRQTHLYTLHFILRPGNHAVDVHARSFATRALWASAVTGLEPQKHMNRIL